jgi:tripartite-type tricarboxylate transporter receptor subunit TctC
MRIIRWLSITASVAGGLALLAALAAAQTFPVKPIRIVTTESASTGDLSARVFTPPMAASLGQNIIIDNRGLTAGELVARAAPDGYTLVYYGAPLWLLQFLRDKVPYNLQRDFAPISLTVSSPLILVVHPSLPVASVRELITFAKSRPGELNSGSGLSGGAPHLACALFKSMTSLDIVHISYKGSAQSLTALIGNEVQIAFPAAGALAPHVKSGRLKALAVSSAQPSELAPGLPTITASGLPGYEATSLYGMFAPAGTPAGVMFRLNQEVVKSLNRADSKEKLLRAGVEVVASTPQQLLTTLKAEMSRMGKVIKEAGIRD